MSTTMPVMSEKWGESPTAARLSPLVEDEPSVSRLELDGLGAASTGPAGLVTVGTIGRAWLALWRPSGDLLDGRMRLRVLEAGARSRTLFDLPDDAYIVGVDRDAAALRSNVRLDERVMSELSDYRPHVAAFDLITSWYVLDGNANTAPLLDRFADWAAPDGLVVQVYFEDADQTELRWRLKVTHGRWKAVQVLVRILSLGLLDAARTDYIVTFRRIG